MSESISHSSGRFHMINMIGMIIKNKIYTIFIDKFTYPFLPIVLFSSLQLKDCISARKEASGDF